MRALLTVLLATLALAACDGGGDPVQQALRETATTNHAATVVETATGPAVDHGASGSQAFAASEAMMHERMMAASGETIDQAYIAKMTEHHRGAVAMAEVALRGSRDPEVRRMAQGVIDAQTREIAEMQAWKPAPTK